MDLSTTYLGIELKSPIVCSSSPLTDDPRHVKKMEEAGAGAVVLPSLFEEQIRLETASLDRALSRGAESYAESLSYLPDWSGAHRGTRSYIDLIHRTKDAVQIPVIASLNGTTPGGWIQYAKEIEDAGADALELNIYDVPADPEVTGHEIEDRLCSLVREIHSGIRIPLAVKLGVNFSSIPNLALRLAGAGARGLVMFNRFYQPDFDLDSLSVVPRLVLSTSEELLMRLHWVALLYGRVNADLAVTGGVHTTSDVLKSMMAGAKIAMTTSALLKHGIGHLEQMHRGLIAWMEEHEYESIRQMQGSMSERNVPDPGVYQRVNYLKVLDSYIHRMRHEEHL